VKNEGQEHHFMYRRPPLPPLHEHEDRSADFHTMSPPHLPEESFILLADAKWKQKSAYRIIKVA
jgi:hypothetical protein